MKEQITSFWINVLGGIATLGITYLIVKIFTISDLVEYIGIFITVTVTILAILLVLTKFFRKNKLTEVQFVTEGVKLTSDGFRVLFSIWNSNSTPIKLYEFFTKEYVRQPSVMYRGGQRHTLKINQNETTLWEGETFTIPTNESVSFDLNYNIDTGSFDGEPWIIFGILLNYHNIEGKKLLHSDSVYLYKDKEVVPIDIDNLEELNEPNMFRHRIYVTTLQELIDNLHYNQMKIAELLINEYKISFRILKDLIIKKNQVEDIQKVKLLELTLLRILRTQKKAEVNDKTLNRKKNILETLDDISRKYSWVPFMDLSQPELNLDYLKDYELR